MPTETQAPQTYTEVYKKLIREKCPEVIEDPQLRIFSSIILSISERFDALERGHKGLRKGVGVMAKLIDAMAGDGAAEEGEEETIEGEPGMTSAATGTAGGTGGGSVKTPPRQHDATPFPAGVPSSKAEADAKAQAPQQNAAPAVDQEERAEDDLTPNAGGGGAVNAQPIPNGPSGPPNQSRVVNVQKNGKGANA